MQGLLLMNLGTPDDTSVPAVRRYLREFLSDPRVIDIHPVGRWLLLNLVILPFRPRKSAEAYEKVWDAERGSPLLYHSQDLAQRVQARLGDSWQVELAMRYGKPTVAAALDRLQAAGVEQVVVLPLYPQHASSTTGSSLEAVYADGGRREVVPAFTAVPAFYDHPAYVKAAAEPGRGVVDEVDHVLFSFHGLPVRQVEKADPSGTHCLKSDACCEVRVAANRNCYRHQCFETARALAGELGLSDDRYSVAFQSRLGRTEWIRPYTDETLHQLAADGVKRLAVFCPAFVSDCLETLEELGIRGRETFLAAGGEDFRLVPCPNASEAFVETVVTLASEAMGRRRPRRGAPLVRPAPGTVRAGPDPD